MTTRAFKESELRDYAYGDHIQSTQDDWNSRWSVGVNTVFQADDNKYYLVYWQQGLTELQEDSFPTEAEEVFPVHTVITSTQVEYLTQEEIDNGRGELTLDAQVILASTLISETAETGIASIQALNVAPILDFLTEASGAILDKKSQDFLIASQQFFSAVATVQAELKK